MSARANTLRNWSRSIAFAVALFSAGPVRAATLEHEFLWTAANSRMACAASENDFLDAARLYLKLVNGGVRNGHLFYNLGTALLKARRYNLAVSSLERAERYLGSTAEIRRNLLLANAGDDKDAEPLVPWTRYLLFWHHGLGIATRITIAVAAFALFWFGLILRALSLRRIAGTLTVISLVVLVLFGSSIAASWNQESRERPIRPETLIAAAPVRPASVRPAPTPARRRATPKTVEAAP